MRRVKLAIDKNIAGEIDILEGKKIQAAQGYDIDGNVVYLLTSNKGTFQLLSDGSPCDGKILTKQ